MINQFAVDLGGSLGHEGRTKVVLDIDAALLSRGKFCGAGQGADEALRYIS
jgi:hypothetical protein